MNTNTFFAKNMKGENHVDDRGSLRFFNDFDFNEVVRFYIIEPSNTQIIRAWQGHLKEKKWFLAIKGSFEVQYIEMLKTKNGIEFGERHKILISNRTNDILEINAPALNGFKAMEPESILLVYSNLSLSDSLKDDFRVSQDEIPW